jgi:hypothetical protein
MNVMSRTRLAGLARALSVVARILIERPSRRTGSMSVSKKPHVFTVRSQGGVDFLGQVRALIDDHASFTRRQPGRSVSKTKKTVFLCMRGNFPRRSNLPYASANVSVGSAASNLKWSKDDKRVSACKREEKTVPEGVKCGLSACQKDLKMRIHL